MFSFLLECFVEKIILEKYLNALQNLDYDICNFFVLLVKAMKLTYFCIRYNARQK